MGGRGGGAALAAVAVRSPRKRRDVDLSSVAVTGEAWDVVRDPRIGLVIDASGDCDAARGWALEGFERGKSFVTAGKALVARHGAELEERAAANGVGFRYEAAVAGALPVVALLRLGLSPGTVRAFEGVVNGTCSYVLSRLAEGVPFAAALDRARQAGLTEADSERDTSGRDAADKLAILARLCGMPIAPAEVSTAGIDGLRPDDVAFGRARGFRLILLAVFRACPGGAIASVAPAFVPADSFLAQARDEENAVLLDGGPAGWLGLLGRGAGRRPVRRRGAVRRPRDRARVRHSTARARVPEAPVVADLALVPHYIRVTRPLGAPAPQRALLRRAGRGGRRRRVRERRPAGLGPGGHVTRAPRPRGAGAGPAGGRGDRPRRLSRDGARRRSNRNHPRPTGARRRRRNPMSYAFDTLAIHAGQPNDEATGSVTIPIHQTSTFGQEEPGVNKGFCYSRTGNPTRSALEANLAALEGGRYGLAFASGLAAVNTVLNLLKPGDHVVAGRDLYGGSYRIFTKVYAKLGIGFSFVDITSRPRSPAALRPETRLLWLESPSNPLLQLVDLAATAAVARARGRPHRGRQHVRDARTSSGRSPSAPTSWSSPRPSTWPATATSSAAPSSPATRGCTRT